MAFKNRIRLPITLAKTQFPVERNVFRLANGARKVLSVVISKTVQGTTDQLPEDWHRKLLIALSHDDVTIEDNRLLTGIVLESDYSIEWQDFLNYPLAQAKFTVNVTPFDATNSNCQSCEEVTQLTVVDDDIAETWSEGTTHTWDNVLANDSICCFPYTVELVSFNSYYFASVTLSDSGQLDATLNPVVPTASNVLVATYRVSCPNGAYDEANIFVDVISGTGVPCEPVTYLSSESAGSNSLSFAWLSSVGNYGWTIATAAAPGTILQSGTTTNEFKLVTGLLPSTSYIFTVWAICGIYELSEVEDVTVSTLPDVVDAPGTIDNGDCAHPVQITDISFNAETATVTGGYPVTENTITSGGINNPALNGELIVTVTGHDGFGTNSRIEITDSNGQSQCLPIIGNGSYTFVNVDIIDGEEWFISILCAGVCP